MNTIYRRFFLKTFILLVCLSCTHNPIQEQQKTEKITVGKAQSQIKKGMSGGEVAKTLGSPNIVSTDENGHEVWVYDKISSSVSQSSSQSGIWLILASVGQEDSKRTSSQKTLTIIINFDKERKVKSLSYHSSSF